MYLPFFDPVYLIFVLPAFLVGIIATILLKVWTNRYLKVMNTNHLTGLQIAEKIAHNENLNFQVNVMEQTLGENYNPSNRTLSVSRVIGYTTSIASAGIIAHELGHIEQHKQGSLLLKLRSALVPAVNIGSNLGYFLLVIGLVLQFTALAWLGIGFFALATVFSLLTLPIEIDASKRALKLLSRNQILFPKEMHGVKLVLAAAALTYVAALFQSLGQLLYFIFRIQGTGSNKND